MNKSIEEFIKYTEKYDLNNNDIKRKQLHSLRVMNICKDIAIGLNLSEEEINLAAIIGLLHDIGRFEQYKQYKTYVDKISVDHGDLGAEILEKDIRKYVQNNNYDEIIKIAVKNHNKYKIQDGLTENQLLFSKIIRDADKIDIYYESVEIFWKNEEYKVNESVVSQEYISDFKKLKPLKSKSFETPIETVIKKIAYIFDMNFKSTFRIIKDEDYINKILNRYDIKDNYTKTVMQEVQTIANNYIDNILT